MSTTNRDRNGYYPYGSEPAPRHTDHGGGFFYYSDQPTPIQPWMNRELRETSIVKQDKVNQGRK